MKTLLPSAFGALALVIISCASFATFATSLQPVTVLSSNVLAGLGGGGDSMAPLVSPDGRYVVFASAANNLAVGGGNYRALMPPKLNVFLRDRASQSTTFVSLNAAATGGGSDDSIPRGVFTNGQFVLFESTASNLVAGLASSLNNVFVRDLGQGVTYLVSIGTNGAAPNGPSHNSVMTPDGRYVAFSSQASNLVPGDTNGIADVFVRDLQSGVTVLASVGATSLSLLLTPGTGGSDLPAISSDGRFVAFYSTATNLAPGAQTVGEIYLRDLIAGETTNVSAPAHSLAQSLLGSSSVFYCCPALSTDGQIVAYQACLSSGSSPGVIFSYDVQTASIDLVNTNALAVAFGCEFNFRGVDMTPHGQSIALIAVLGPFPHNSNAIVVWNAQTGATATASVDVNNFPATTGISVQPQLDSSGRFVAFMSVATNLTTNSIASGFHLYVRDLQAGATTLVDADTNGVGSIANLGPFWNLSADGSVVAFAAWGGALLPNDNNQAYDMFARSLTNNSLELISAHQPALPLIAADAPSAITNQCASVDGRFVAFTSQADNLTVGGANGYPQVFVRDLIGGATTLVSIDTNGILPGNGASMAASISSDGRSVVFASSASNLVAFGTANASDVFVRDLQLGATALVSVNTNNNGPGSGASYAPTMSTNGRYVLFRSSADNLAAGSFPPSTVNFFWRDLQLGVTRAVAISESQGSLASAAMTPDGQNVAWSSGYSGSPLYLWNAQAAANTYTNNNPNVSVAAILAISSDGTRIAAYTSSFHVVDSTGQTNFSFPSALFPAAGVQFSSDGRYLVYVFDTVSSRGQIYLYDLQTGTNLLVSAGFTGQGPANGKSDSPAISPDGLFVAYRSAASNLVPGDNNGLPDVFLFDQVTGATTLVSVSQFGSLSANGPSLKPVFSGDSRTLFFQSWASDLLGGFFNSNGEVWALSLYSTNLPPAFRTTIGTAFASGQGPTLLWSVAPGNSYQVQFKNELSDPSWQPLASGLIIVGNQGYFNNPAPPAGHRFYRIVSF